MPFRGMLTVLGFALCIDAASAQDGSWAVNGGGSWASAGNWDSGIIADGSDNTAFFGSSLYPITSTSVTFTLDGSRTIGAINLYGPAAAATWSLKTGTAGPLTLDATFDTPSVYVTPAALQFTISVAVAGTAGLEKLAPGALVLSATNTYTGGTTVSQGALLVNGVIADTNGITVAGGTLGGSGRIAGPVVIQSGGLLSPGGSPGTLAISNSLTLQSGSKTWIDINAATLAHDSIVGITAVTYGGTLTVSNLAGTPAVGQSYHIFSAGSASADFSGVSPQLSGGARWRFDPNAGTLSVVATNAIPRFSSVTQSGYNLIFNVTNGLPDGTNFLSASTNLTWAGVNWTRLSTNWFDAAGNLTVTQAVSAGVAQSFYQISTP